MSVLKAQVAAAVCGLKAVLTCLAAGHVLKGEFKTDLVSYQRSRLQQSADDMLFHSTHPVWLQASHSREGPTLTWRPAWCWSAPK